MCVCVCVCVRERGGEREREREREIEMIMMMMMMMMMRGWAGQLLHSERLKTIPVPTIPCSSILHLSLTEPNRLLHNYLILQNADISHASIHTHTHIHTQTHTQITYKYKNTQMLQIGRKSNTSVPSKLYHQISDGKIPKTHGTLSSW